MADKNMRRSASVVLDGTGYGAVRIAPSGGKQWAIKYMSVSVSTATSEAKCTIYENQIATGKVIDVTITGSSGDTTDTAIQVFDGYALWIEWQHGDAGATATVTWSGEEF